MKMIIISRPLINTSNNCIFNLISSSLGYSSQIYTDVHSKKVIDECLISGRYPNVIPLDELVELAFSDYQIPLFIYCPSPSDGRNRFVQLLIQECETKGRTYTMLI